MHPVNNNNFGVHGMAVSFYNGTSVVTGYVSKQLGTNKFIVTDGTTEHTLTLASTTAIATSLSGNTTNFTIPVVTTGGTQYAMHIYSNQVMTTEGNIVKWHLGASVDGSAYIVTYS